MREINTIVIHHSATPRDLSLEKSVQSFDKTHAKRLHEEKNSKGYHIAYHYVISADGKKICTRSDAEVGYHASSLSINRESVGICLLGNFDIEEPTKEQIKTLENLIFQLSHKHLITKIIGHCDVPSVQKSCPGKNLHEKLEEIVQAASVPEWARDTVDRMSERGISTSPLEEVGDMKLYHLLAVMDKYLEKTST